MYSLVRNVLHLDLYDTSTEEDVHINQVLIDEGFASFQEESRASKVTEAHVVAYNHEQILLENAKNKIITVIPTEEVSAPFIPPLTVEISKIQTCVR